jgi:hypothetical protein
MSIHHRLIATACDVQRPSQGVDTPFPVSQTGGAGLSADAFRGLLRILKSPICLESNTLHKRGTTDTMPTTLGTLIPSLFLHTLLAKIPAHYDPKVYLHGSLANEKKLSGFAKAVPPQFNDIDILIAISVPTYDIDAQDAITAAIQGSYREIVSNHSDHVLEQRGFQKRNLIGTPENRYDYRGAIMTLGPRHGSNMMELKILALGPYPIDNHSSQLASQCSSSLDSLMIGPLNPLLQCDATLATDSHTDTVSRKSADDFRHALGENFPQKISKYFYSDADIHLVETQNIIIAHGWNIQLSLTRLAKQAMSPNGIRVGSPLIIESIAKNISEVSPIAFEEDLERYLRVHFPHAESAEKTAYCIVVAISPNSPL